MQSPSSLIFLVLLGVWAAYFVQYWVRRRDHVATARSVEQFSEAMRVLERRLPRTDLSEQAPRSYAVHPARSSRPQVLVKRAVPAETAGPRPVTARVEDIGDAVHEVGPVGARPVRPRLRPSRRVRGLLVLAALVELVVIVPLVALSMLPVWALATALVAVVATFAFLRSGARAEQAMMRAHRRRQADIARLRSSAPVTATGGRRPATRRVPADRPHAASTASAPAVEVARSPLDVALEVAPATPAAGPVVESSVVTAPEAEAPAPADVMVPILDDDDMPLTWDPVPVPRPTYTMKAKAERREVPPADVTPDTAPVVREDADDTEYEQQRVAGA